MIRVVTLQFKQEHVSDFLELFDERKEQIRNFPGCTHLQLWQDADEPTIFYTYSWWNHADDLENYRISTLFQDTWGRVKKWFSAPPRAFSSHEMITLS
ncbi:MAG: antibiotic biosynthesis monooxygenase [Chitinophagaceae bacterium]|nr:antibiotic biosynthesis monooxygenase [Chitinophagaceae bacterium]